MVNDDPPRLALTRPEAAQAIGVSARSIDALIADRTSGFPILRLGTRVLVPVKELTEWLTEQTRKKGGRQ
jgi:excisionase family DNA binding protein